MRFRFDFKQIADGKFLVDAHASGGTPRGGRMERRNSAAVLYASCDVFLKLIRTAGLPADAIATLEQAVRTSASQPGTSICCSEVDLSETHLIHLNLKPARELYL